jgi:tRNA threonylcarbamoyladenosine biosynthesis protein TsaE
MSQSAVTTIEIANAAAMYALGKSLGGNVKAGDLILLNGALGAGKTVLVQGIGSALGFDEITSPTFVISRIHQGALPLIHVDVYRLLDSGNAAAYLDDLDLDTAREDAVTVIEWGGPESARLSDDRLEIEIDRSDEIRRVSVKTIGDRWQGFSL